MKQGILYTARDFIAHCCVNASKCVRCEEKMEPGDEARQRRAPQDDASRRRAFTRCRSLTASLALGLLGHARLLTMRVAMH